MRTAYCVTAPGEPLWAARGRSLLRITQYALSCPLPTPTPPLPLRLRDHLRPPRRRHRVRVEHLVELRPRHVAALAHQVVDAAARLERDLRDLRRPLVADHRDERGHDAHGVLDEPAHAVDVGRDALDAPLAEH